MWQCDVNILAHDMFEDNIKIYLGDTCYETVS